ncbi:MAG: SMP-30/gluconolactonase/LRE family protein [Terriglobia bacterium]
MPEISIVADYGDLCGEGPIWDVKTQRLYWTDITGQKFYSYDWKSKEHRVFKEGFEVGGAAFNRPGGFVIANTSGFWLWEVPAEPRLIAEHADGHKCQLNDCIADPAGRFLAGSVFYDPAKDYPLGKLIRLDKDGTAHVLDEGIHLANGLGFSVDAKTLYLTDSAARTIYAYDFDARTGSVSNRRVFVKVPSTSGLPDGLTVDAEDFVWSAEWYGSRVVRYDPDGKIERTIATPAKQTSSLAFGGPELTDIFITSAARSEVMPIMPPGYDPNTGYFGGALYHVNLGIRGKAEFVADIQVGK